MTKVGQGTFAAIITPPLSKSPLQAPLTSTRQNLAPFLEPARRIQYNLVFLLLLLLFSILGMLIKNYRKRSWYQKNKQKKSVEPRTRPYRPGWPGYGSRSCAGRR